MQNYLDLLKKIRDNGYDHPDRTGVGRRSLYGEQLRFKMSDGFPLVTTRKVPYKSMIKETLWFLTGSMFSSQLREQGSAIWDQWEVKPEHADSFGEIFIRKLIEESMIERARDALAEGQPDLTEEEIAKVKEDANTEVGTVVQSIKDTTVGSIGTMYGYSWRFAPAGDVCLFYPDVDEEDIASDRLEAYKREAPFPPSERHGRLWQAYLKARHYEHIDQMQQLVLGLKRNPFGSRHVVTAWIPEFKPFEQLSPEHNVIMGKGALAACHCMFQCFVREENGVKKLSLLVYVRSNDFPVGAVFNISQYALLLHMLAQVTGYEADELIYNTGDVHIYHNQLEQVNLQLSRTPKALPKLWLNPEIKDLFKFTADDIKVVDYDPDESIVYPVAK